MSKNLFIGIDGGSENHACMVMNESAQTIWKCEFANHYEGFQPLLDHVESWIQEGNTVWVAAEGRRGYLSPLDKELCARGCKYVTVNPLQLKRYREGMTLQPDKDDEKDAELIAKFLKEQVKENQARVLEEENEYFETIRDTARALTQTTDSKVRLQNQLVSLVREYWPELMQKGRYFCQTDTVGLLALLQKYPTPDAICRAGRARVNRVLTKATGCEQMELTERLLHDARAIRKRAGVLRVSVSKVRLVKSLAAGICQFQMLIRELDRSLEEQLKDHPFGEWLLQQPGIGTRTAGCFVGEAGDLNRFDSEEKLARYAGNGGIKKQSGKSKVKHWDGHRYNHRLKRAIMLMAKCRANHHEESKTYVNCLKEPTKIYWAIIKKLARHLIRFLWKGWEKTVNKPLETVESFS